MSPKVPWIVLAASIDVPRFRANLPYSRFFWVRSPCRVQEVMMQIALSTDEQAMVVG